MAGCAGRALPDVLVPNAAGAKAASQ